MAGLYDNIINDIIGGAGGSPEIGADAPPVMNLSIHDNDGDEICDNCFVVEDGEFKKLKLKELRRRKCEWSMLGAPLMVTGCKLSFKPVEDETTGEIVAWDCKAHAWDHKGRKWETFEDDFGKNFDKHFCLKDGEGQKMEDLLMQKNDPETGRSFELVMYLPLKF